MTKPYGMTQPMFDAYIAALAEARVNPERTRQGGRRVVQTIGGAAASAGTHLQDGRYKQGDKSEPYTCALDISVRHDLTRPQIEKLLKALWAAGFAAWWRHTGSFAGNEHIHAVYAGHRMKASLRAQVHSFLRHRSGLVGDAADEFVRDNLTPAAEQHIRALFLAVNPAKG